MRRWGVGLMSFLHEDVTIYSPANSQSQRMEYRRDLEIARSACFSYPTLRT